MSDEVDRSADKIQAQGVPEVPALLVEMNIAIRRLLRAGVASALVLEMVQDSVDVALHQAWRGGAAGDEPVVYFLAWLADDLQSTSRILFRRPG